MAVHIFSQVTMGLGEITINGNSVGWLKGEVEYKTEGELVESWKGTPVRCTRRSWSNVVGKLSASAAEINSANIGYFLLGSTPSEVLPEYTVVFTHQKPGGGSITVTMNANVIPIGGMKFSEDTWTLTGVDIRSVGSSLPTVSNT